MTSWPTVQLGDLLTDIQPGFASGKHNSTGAGVPHFRPMNVSTEGRIDRSALKSVDRSLADQPVRRLRKGDVLFNNTNSPELVGKTALFEDDDQPAFSNHMTRLRVDASVLDPGFLALRLHQAWRAGWFAAHCNNHVSQASIGRDVLRSFEIELPPLGEQHLIVSFGRTTDDRRLSCTRHLVVASATLSRFRQAVFAAASSGRLTTTWRGHADDADLELPTDWELLPLSNIAERVTKGTTPTSNGHAFTESGVSFVKVENLRRGKIDAESIRSFIAESTHETQTRSMLQEGDLLFSIAGTIGRTAIVRREDLPANTNQALAIIRGTSNVVAPEYLAIALQSAVQDTASQAARGSGMNNISLADVRRFEVAVPPRAEQDEIVLRVEQLLGLADGLQRRIDVADGAVRRASRAALEKAFRGELLGVGADM